MRVAIQDRKIPGRMYPAVMPDFTDRGPYSAYFARILSELGSPLKNLVTFQYKESLPGGFAIFEVITPDHFRGEGGHRPQYDRLKALLQKQIQQDVNKQSGLSMMDIASVPTERISPPLPIPGPKPIPVTEDGDAVVTPKPSKPTIPFEEGKVLEITLSDATMQSSDVKSTLAKGGSIGDLIIYDLIDEGIQQYERAKDSYSEHAKKLAGGRKGGAAMPIKAFYHPLMFVMKDPLKVATDKAALQNGMIVEGNRIVIPSALITPTLRPFLDKLLIPKPSYTVRFVSPEPTKIVTSEFTSTKSAESSNKNYYILGGAILLTAGLTAFFMRRR